MLLANRLFERQKPSRKAKSLYIFCEGQKREYEYFMFFKEKDSRVNVEIYKLSHDEDNSPLGLLEIAKKNIIQTKNNPDPKYTFQRNDEVWIVLDKDPDIKHSRKAQIKIIRKKCDELTGWNIVESNPCFEVWLYYHKNKKFFDFPNNDVCKGWKKIVSESFRGGFDSRRHPIFIEEAAQNSRNNLRIDSTSNLSIGSTELYRLAESIMVIMKEKINRVKSEITM